MESVFENAYKTAETWDMQGAIILFTGGNTDGATETNRGNQLQDALIVRSLSVSYQRPVQRIYPINISKAIQLVGIPQGTIQMDMLWGPGTALKTFLSTYKKACAGTDGGASTSITIIPFGRTSCTNEQWTNHGKLTAMSPVIGSLTVAVQSADGGMPVYAGVGMSFIDLLLD